MGLATMPHCQSGMQWTKGAGKGWQEQRVGQEQTQSPILPAFALPEPRPSSSRQDGAQVPSEFSRASQSSRPPPAKER
eukprot:1147813-Karenia_brevis.AAC.1